MMNRGTNARRDERLQRAGRTLVVLLGLVAMTAAGCSTQREFADWQGMAAIFVAEQANHDLTALTDHHERDGHRLFKVLGDDDPDVATDAVGVYLGQRRIHNQPWLIFLVGQVESRQLSEARVVAVTQNAGELTWAIGQPIAAATSAYNRYHWLREDRPPYAGWPRRSDQYRLTLTDDVLYVTETTTHAVWFLKLDQLDD